MAVEMRMIRQVKLAELLSLHNYINGSKEVNIMRKLKFFAWVGVIALGACTHYGEDLSSLESEMAKPVTIAMVNTEMTNPQEIAPAAGGMMMPAPTAAPVPAVTAVAAPDALPQYLAREYYAMAKYENDKAYDYKAAKDFTQKAMTSAKGKTVEPSKVSAFDLSAQRATELSTARADLMGALAEQNTPDNAQILAKAQARYECWIERAEEAVNDDHYASCKSEFEAAMATLTMPAAGEPQSNMVGNDQQNFAPASQTATPARPVWKEEPTALDFLGQGVPPKTN
jgi:hypothetical protein